MNKVRIDFGPGNSYLIEGLRTIRKSEGVFAVVDEAVQGIANRAGEGFVGDTIVGVNRCQGAVKTKDKDAFYRAVHTHALSKALR